MKTSMTLVSSRQSWKAKEQPQGFPFLSTGWCYTAQIPWTLADFPRFSCIAVLAPTIIPPEVKLDNFLRNWICFS